MLSDEEVKLYLRAGRIAGKSLLYGMEIIHEGMPVIELCEKIEGMIVKLGGQPAFPCNISINDVAAHYTSPPDDDLTVPKGSLVKIDVGVHVNGYIADTAGTVAFRPEHERLMLASKKALEAALTAIKSGVSLGMIGTIIERTARGYGFTTIRNLTGHKIKPWILHAGKSVPNVSTMTLERMKEGEVYAIEPFLTPGKGFVVEEDRTYIFSYAGGKAKGSKERALLHAIWSRFRSLPFCERWLIKIAPENSDVLQALRRKRLLNEYPVLREAGRGIVAQWEHTVIVTKKGSIVTTAIE